MFVRLKHDIHEPLTRWAAEDHVSLNTKLVGLIQAALSANNRIPATGRQSARTWTPTRQQPAPPRKETYGLQLRLDPVLAHAFTSWAQDENRSTNTQLRHILLTALRRAGRLSAITVTR
jgi:hypothetical protein